MKKQTILISVIVGLILVAIFFSPFLDKEKPNIIVDDELVINNFDYNYSALVSHLCPGTSEDFSFILNETVVIIHARDRKLREGRTDPPAEYCGTIGVLPDFYDEALSNCKSIDYDYLPQDDFIQTRCKTEIRFKILDSDSVNNCLSEESCELVNGVDVEFVK